MAAASKKSFKERKLQQKTVRHKSVPWWTKELTIMCKKINAMRRRYQRTLQDSNMREARKQQYLQGKRKYEATLRKMKIVMEAIVQHHVVKSLEHGLQACNW